MFRARDIASKYRPFKAFQRSTPALLATTESSCHGKPCSPGRKAPFSEWNLPALCTHANQTGWWSSGQEVINLVEALQTGRMESQLSIRHVQLGFWTLRSSSSLGPLPRAGGVRHKQNAEPTEPMELSDAVFTLAQLAAIQDTVLLTVQAAFQSPPHNDVIPPAPAFSSTPSPRVPSVVSTNGLNHPLDKKYSAVNT